MIDRELLEYARTANLPAFLESEFGLRPVGNKGFFPSPFRSESNPSLHVSCREGIWIWYDHGAADRRGGDAIELLRHLGCSFKEAAKRLAVFNGWDGDINKGRIREEKRETKRIEPSRTLTTPSILEKIDKILFVRDTYAGLSAPGMGVRRYFTDRGLHYHPEIGARLFVDFKKSTKYVAFPLPNPSVMRGLELREAIPASRELSTAGKMRKCYGLKSLWVLRRRSDKMLIAESIMDALAGEVLFGYEDATLVALNGVPQASEVGKLILWMKESMKLSLREVIVAIDSDDPGREATMVIRKAMDHYRIMARYPELTEKDTLRELLSRNRRVARRRVD